jgi:hypothetical protein
MRRVFPGVHLRRSKAMTHEINGFVVAPSSSNRHLLRRVTEPRHEYIFYITPEHIVLRATLPDDVGVDRQFAAGYPTRERFLTELTLDPPDATSD